MSVRLAIVTRRAMSWSFVLASLFLPAQRTAAQTVMGVISDQRIGTAPDSAHMAAVLAVLSPGHVPTDTIALRFKRSSSSSLISCFNARSMSPNTR